MQMVNEVKMTEGGAQTSVSFSCRRVLITGGSRGIAAEIACVLAANGAAVCFSHSAKHDASAGFSDAARHLVEDVSAAGGHAVAIELDMSEPGAGSALAVGATEALGQIDGLVLSASVQIEKPLAKQSDVELELQYRMNLTANIELLNALLPSMAEKRFGRVLAIGSVQEVVPSPRMPVYAMTKAALSNLLVNLAREYASNGVTLNVLSPGLIETGRNAERRADPVAWAQFQRNANPMARAGTPQEIAHAALFLLSEGASFVTGANLFASGGGHIGCANTASENTPINRNGERSKGA